MILFAEYIKRGRAYARPILMPNDPIPVTSARVFHHILQSQMNVACIAGKEKYFQTETDNDTVRSVFACCIFPRVLIRRVLDELLNRERVGPDDMLDTFPDVAKLPESFSVGRLAFSSDRLFDRREIGLVTNAFSHHPALFDRTKTEPFHATETGLNDVRRW